MTIIFLKNISLIFGSYRSIQISDFLSWPQFSMGHWKFQRSGRDRDLVPENFQSPGPSPGILLSQRQSLKFKISVLHDVSPFRSRIFSNLSPGPGSRKIWNRVPVPVPDFKISPGSGPGTRFPESGLREPCHGCRPLIETMAFENYRVYFLA